MGSYPAQKNAKVPPNPDLRGEASRGSTLQTQSRPGQPLTARSHLQRRRVVVAVQVPIAAFIRQFQ